MPLPTLGRLEKVDPHSIWNNESEGLAAWLAREGNIAALGEAIGMTLAAEAQEKEASPFHGDVLCKDTASGRWVLVGSQLDRTDHAYLGQLLTHAAGLKPVTVVWIAKEFAAEHRATLDWLNEIANPQLNFVGLEIELWRIGNSPVAPKFNIVSRQDNSPAREPISPPESGVNETGGLHYAYWSAFRDYLIQRQSMISPAKPARDNWVSFAIGRMDFVLTAFFNTQEKRIGVGLVLSGPEAKAHFRLLERDRQQIESEIGSELDWDELPSRKESHIYLHNRTADPVQSSEWPSQHAWLCEGLEAFDRVFRPRIKALDAGAEAKAEGKGAA